jgi:microcystin-dependent protein
MATPFIGQITLFAGNFAPRGYRFCDGSLLAISQNTALFSILGTTYGGNGQTNFALPDLRGRVPIHAGVGPGLSSYVLGEKAGVEQVTLLSTQIPSHVHGAGVNASTGASNTVSPGGAVLAVSAQGNAYATGNPTLSAMSTSAATVLNAGGNQPHSNMQPYLALNFIIATQGIFPARN